jgi:hypothetical protein
MHEIKRVADESTSGSEDGQRAHRGDKQAKPSPLNVSTALQRFNASTVHVTDAAIAPIFSTGKLGLSPFPSFHVGLLRSNQHHSGLLDNFYGSLAAGGDID